MIRRLVVAVLLLSSAAHARGTPAGTAKNFTPPPDTPAYFTNEGALPGMLHPPEHAGPPGTVETHPVAVRPAPASVRTNLIAVLPRLARKPTPPLPVETDLVATVPRPARKPAPPSIRVAVAAQHAAGRPRLAELSPLISASRNGRERAVAIRAPAGWTAQDRRPYNRRMTAMIPFLKMQGLGNDFVVLDGRGELIGLNPAGIRMLADRRAGIGCDQVIMLEPPRHPAAQVRMRIYNADGGEVEACGNATRCVALVLAQETGERRLRIETAAGLLEADRLADGRIAVDMGPARAGWQEIPLARAMDTERAELALGPLSEPVCTNIGNPHATFFVADAEAVDLAQLGPVLEYDPLFPERANIGVATVHDRSHLRLRVWERGAGLTPACGSGACAALVAAHRRGLAERRATVALDGGELEIAWREDGHVMMTGPAALVFEGRIARALLIGAD